MSGFSALSTELIPIARKSGAWSSSNQSRKCFFMRFTDRLLKRERSVRGKRACAVSSLAAYSGKTTRISEAPMS